MTKPTLTAAFLAALVLASAAPGAGPSLAPHVYATKIAGATPAVLNGTWRLTLRPATFSVAKGGVVAVSGSLRIAGNRVTFHDRSGSFACHGTQAVGVYTWRIAGSRLTLTPVTEPCGGRRTILTKPFTRTR